MAKRIAFRVEGDVQGVGFRYFTQKRATAYGVTGWVRNTTKGEVEGEAQGEDDTLQKFVTEINKGPSQAHVTKLDQSDLDVKEGESDFQTRS